MATGTAVSAGTLEQTTSANCGRTGYAFKFSGVTLTGTGILYLRTRIESKDAIWLKNQVASFQAKVYHDTGSAINYTVYVKKANAADDFSSTTAIGNSGAISVTSATATTIKYEAISMGDCSNGIEIEIKIECGEVTTKNFEFTEMQMELGSKSTEVELKPFADVVRLCQRYYYTWKPTTAYSPIGLGYVWDSTNCGILIALPVALVKNPSLTVSATMSEFRFLSGGAIITPTTMVLGDAGAFVGEMNALLACTCAGGLTAGYSVVLGANNSTNCYLKLDAEL
jgi:hypothetical protein